MTVETAPPALDGLTFVRPLGAGGYAHVYLYENQRPRLEVAVKVMDSERLTADLRDQFMAEANAMAELSHHPYIAQVHRADVTPDGRPYIVMKYYPGETYAVRVREAAFSVPDVLRAGVRVACAVETAHRAGILHRDIKPANILTDQYDIPALTDFGIAVASDQTVSDAEGMSLPWAPPETVFSTRPPGVSSDMYSLGATIWHLLVGRSPFHRPGEDNGTVALMRRIESTPPPPTGRGDVPASLERLLASCLAKSPDDRPTSALDLARSLQAVEQERQLPLTPLALLDEGGVRRASRQLVGDETRIRAPQTVNPQPSSVAGARERVLPLKPALEETVRPVKQPPAPAIETKPTKTPRVHRGVAIGALVAVVVGVAAVLAFLSGGGKSAEKNQPASVVPQSVGLVAAPGTPDVTASRSGRAVVFRWSYANPMPSDTFRWRRSGSLAAAQGATDARTLHVAAKRGDTVCLSVQVVRNDGSSPSSFSDPSCAR